MPCAFAPIFQTAVFGVVGFQGDEAFGLGVEIVVQRVETAA
ncbi:hypothetical protein [Neisseria elongata]|nr:hypothetical protein [Neisseria elongata]